MGSSLDAPPLLLARAPSTDTRVLGKLRRKDKKAKKAKAGRAPLNAQSSSPPISPRKLMPKQSTRVVRPLSRTNKMLAAPHSPNRLQTSGTTCYGKQLSELGPNPTPFVLPISWLEQHAVRTEGLFRLAGSNEEIEMLCTMIGANELSELPRELDAHSVSGCLQRFLRELPEPVLTSALYQSFVAAKAAPAEQLSALLKRLPPANYAVLRRLMALLARVAANVGQCSGAASLSAQTHRACAVWQRKRACRQPIWQLCLRRRCCDTTTP